MAERPICRTRIRGDLRHKNSRKRAPLSTIQISTASVASQSRKHLPEGLFWDSIDFGLVSVSRSLSEAATRDEPILIVVLAGTKGLAYKFTTNSELHLPLQRCLCQATSLSAKRNPLGNLVNLVSKLRGEYSAER